MNKKSDPMNLKPLILMIKAHQFGEIPQSQLLNNFRQAKNWTLKSCNIHILPDIIARDGELTLIMLQMANPDFICS